MSNMNRLLLALVLISLVEVRAQEHHQQLRKRPAVQTDADLVLVEEKRHLQLPRNIKNCASGPNTPFPCESDSDCGTVCSQNPTQICQVDGQCAGDDNVCSEIANSCKLYVMATEEPSVTPSMSQMPSQEPSPGSEPPSLTPSISPMPSSEPSTTPMPSESMVPTDIPSSVPSSEPTVSAQPSMPSSPEPSQVPTTSGMPSSFPSGGPTSQPSVTFFAMGDVPFSKQESCLIPYELDKLSSSDLGGQFLVHLGDIRDSFMDETMPCPDFMFQNVVKTFSSCPIQAFFLPGERGWLDCPSPGMAYGHFESYLSSFNNSDWPEFPSEVARHPNRTELFSFVQDGVLFLGQSLPGPARDEAYESKIRADLIQDNIDWTKQALAEHIGEFMAVVVFGNDFLSTVNEEYVKEITSLASTEFQDFPVLLLQNGQSFRKTTYEGTTFRTNIIADLNATNVMWAQTDDTVTPLAITVDPWAAELEEIFQFDRRCYCTFGHRPTRKKSYLPWERCAGVCDEGYSQCETVDSCSPMGNTC